MCCCCADALLLSSQLILERCWDDLSQILHGHPVPNLLGAEERSHEREQALYDDLLSRIAEDVDALRELGMVTSGWDVASCLAEVAHQHDYVRPLVDDSTTLSLEEARHPVVEHYVDAGCFVPNDTVLDAESRRLMLITGPNMAGKSTLMRQVALCALL